MPLHYKPLDPSLRQIRLLTLLPPSRGEISAQLHVVSLEDRPVFDALSYVWGVENDPVPIYINGEPFEVTKNLKAALSRLQDSKPIVIWVDAICIRQGIDQESIEEKNHQIPLMRDIYTQASQVIAWLGEGDKYIDALFRFAQGLVNNGQSSSETGSIESRPLHDIEAHIGILNLFLLPYWQRVWTFQEISLPESDPVCVYGKSRCKLSVFLISNEHGIFATRLGGNNDILAAELARLDPPTYGASDSVTIFNSRFHAEALVTINGIVTARSQTKQNGYSDGLYGLLAATVGRKSFDARDRVYALYGLVKHIQDVFPPDYSQMNSLEKVLVQTTTWLIDGGYGPALFDMFGLHPSRFTENSSLPSWVPDFNSTSSYFKGGEPVSTAESLRERSPTDLRPATHDRNLAVLLGLPGVGVVVAGRPEREAIPASLMQFTIDLTPWALEWLQRQGFDVSMAVPHSPEEWHVIQLPGYREPNAPPMARQGNSYKQAVKYFLGDMPAIRITARNLGRCRLMRKFESDKLVNAHYIKEILWSQRQPNSWAGTVKFIEWIRKLDPASEDWVDLSAAKLQTPEYREFALSYENADGLFQDESLMRRPSKEELSVRDNFAAFIMSSAAAMNGFHVFEVDIVEETCLGFTREPIETGDLVIMPLAPYEYPLVLRTKLPKDPNSAETSHERSLHGTWNELDWYRMVGVAFIEVLNRESLGIAQLVKQRVQDFYIR